MTDGTDITQPEETPQTVEDSKPKLRGNEPLLDMTMPKPRKRVPTTHDVIFQQRIIGTSASAEERARILHAAHNEAKATERSR